MDRFASLQVSLHGAHMALRAQKLVLHAAICPYLYTGFPFECTSVNSLKKMVKVWYEAPEFIFLR